MKNGFKMTPLAVGDREVTPQSSGDVQVYPMSAVGLFLEHPLNGARLMSQCRAECLPYFAPPGCSGEQRPGHPESIWDSC